jgi:dihydrofolate reductase
MGRIVSTFFISLDGVVESPEEWHFPYFNDEMGAAFGHGLATCDAFLMGRVLYEEWVEYWPKYGAVARPPGEPPVASEFADFINGVPKYVVSSSLTEASWSNTTILSGDVAAQLRGIKQRTAGDIGMSGSATLVRSLLADGLLDELRLLIHPIAVGHGQRLFEDTPTHPLRLVHHEAFRTGVLNVAYAPTTS